MDLQKLAKSIIRFEEILNLSLTELKDQLTITHEGVKYVPKFDNDFHLAFLEKLINPNLNINVVYNKIPDDDKPLEHFFTNTILTKDNIAKVLK